MLRMCKCPTQFVVQMWPSDVVGTIRVLAIELGGAMWLRFSRRSVEAYLGNFLQYDIVLGAICSTHRTFSSTARSILLELTDLTLSHTWYPYARKKKRHVVLHVGPTNSGKTFNALQSLQQSACGIYCGPLRLLAWEVAEKLNDLNIPCSLLTGQERKEIDGAQHKAMTVEMADITREYDCAVIDEIQMIGCSRRGFAFTRALFGLAVKELHLCGDSAVVSLIQDLVAFTGDSFEVRCYTRLSPLVPLRKPLLNLKYVRGGDCVVTFSRQEIHVIKKEIEELHPAFRCSVVYGSLPSETRTKQAEQFNNSDNDCNVLAASDAIGMGLNLNIQRVIFTKLDKFDGIARCYLSVMQIKQIAGRAGRFNSKYPAGEVTCLKQTDLPNLHKALAAATPPVQAAGIFPTFDQLGLYSSFHPSLSFAAVLEKFIASVKLSPLYFLCDSANILGVAKMIDDIPMPLEARFLFCTSPVDKENRISMGALLEFVKNYAVSRKVPLRKLLQPATMRVPRTQTDLAELESLHKVLDMYIWLSYRFEDAFVDRALALSQKQLCSALIEEGLNMLNAPRAQQSASKRGLLRDLVKSGLLLDEDRVRARRVDMGVRANMDVMCRRD